MALPYRLLRGDRRRPLLPHRLLAPLRASLLATAEICRAFAGEFDDERWDRAARAVDAAAECLRDVSR